MIQSQHSNVQVTITVTCLNFAGTGSRISLPPLSSSRRRIPSQRIALNSNGEVNYRELAQRPWVQEVPATPIFGPPLLHTVINTFPKRTFIHFSIITNSSIITHSESTAHKLLYFIYMYAFKKCSVMKVGNSKLVNGSGAWRCHEGGTYLCHPSQYLNAVVEGISKLLWKIA